jgi:hypothetical protein
VARRTALRRVRPNLAVLRRTVPPTFLDLGMSAELDEAVELSAQAVAGRTVADEDGVESFEISDGEERVRITHEIGNPEAAARRLTELAHAAVLHAERIRGRNRAEVSWT